MNTKATSFRATPLLAALSLFAAGAGHATGIPFDTYIPLTGELAIPQVSVGSVIYRDVVIRVGALVSPPDGPAPLGDGDSYEPATGNLTIPAVAVGEDIYFNVIAKVSGLVSIGSVTGADGFSGTELTIPAVLYQGGVYTDVVIAAGAGNVVRIDGGMPAAAEDRFDPTSGQLQIAAVTVNSRVYTNVVIATNASHIVAVGGEHPTESVVRSFSGNGGVTGSSDGAAPAGVIQATDGNFYVTTSFGGSTDQGAIVRVTPAGIESVFYSFTGNGGIGGSNDAAQPYGALVQGADGSLYGTTFLGGANDSGAVFVITPQGSESVLYSLGAGSDGAYPDAGLIQGPDGTFYGTTTAGGVNGQGCVYGVTPQGTERVLYSFAGGKDGASPQGALLRDTAGNLYGTTRQGGAHNRGTVFAIMPGGTESVLYSFTGGADGGTPVGALVAGKDGDFYGTTSDGGIANVANPSGGGTVFRITPTGTASVVYAFGGGADAAVPLTGLILGNDGKFYGTGSAGGQYSQGAVFSLTTTGQEKVLYSFTGNGGIAGSNDGSSPQSPLLETSGGAFYGVALAGGRYGQGTLFELFGVIP